jgi:hypothetical protein
MIIIATNAKFSVSFVASATKPQREFNKGIGRLRKVLAYLLRVIAKRHQDLLMNMLSRMRSQNSVPPLANLLRTDILIISLEKSYEFGRKRRRQNLGRVN